MSFSLSTHLVSGARSLLSAQLASEGFPVDSSELAVNQGWRQNLFFFSLLFFFCECTPLGRASKNGEAQNLLSGYKWAQDMGLPFEIPCESHPDPGTVCQPQSKVQRQVFPNMKSFPLRQRFAVPAAD